MNIGLARLQHTFVGFVLMSALVGQARAEALTDAADSLLDELATPSISNLEELVRNGSGTKAQEGFASYYAKRFEGRKTASGFRYRPEKMTAAHHTLPLGTVVRVVNPLTLQEVHVTIIDRCAQKPFPFIDLSRAAAKKIGLWGKGRMKVVIIPLLDEPV